MTAKNDSISKDERALEALLAAAFRLDAPEEVSDEDAEKLFQRPLRLSKEEKEAIDSWGADFVERLLKGEKSGGSKRQDETIDEELGQEAFALNRDADGDGLDEQAQQKIDEERKKALEEEEKKHGDEADEL